MVAAVLDTLCRLLHPVMPFLTEQIWQPLGQLAPSRGLPSPGPAEPSVCVAAWPQPLGWTDPEARATVAQWQEKIQAIRNLRAERNVPQAAKIAPIIVAEGPVADRLRQGEAFLRSLTTRPRSRSPRLPCDPRTRRSPSWPTPRSSCPSRA